MSGKERFRLRVRSDFSASHFLRDFGGKCESLHGHNFGVEVEIEGDKLDPKVEFLVDFGEIKRELSRVMDYLDHNHLNELAPFDRINPTSENLARFIFERMAPWAGKAGLKLCSVTVSENDRQSATYLEG